MSKIENLPLFERPREKALRFGISSLADYELLAMIIGKGSKEKSALDLAFSLLSDKRGLVGLYQSKMSDLIAYKGISYITALKLLSLFEFHKRYEKQKNLQNENKEELNNNYFFKKYYDELVYLSNERLIVVVLNGSKEIIHESIVFMGSENEMPASTRAILWEILHTNGKYFYLIHNHPNGNKEHSSADLVFIDQLIHETKKLNLRLIDSIVISKDGYSSYFKTIESEI